MLAETEKQMDLNDAKRAAEWQAREKKIRDCMDRMGDVFKKSDAAEKEFDMRILRDQLKKDKEAEERETKTKRMMRERDIEVKKTLDM